jgi:hypothetical protein
MKPILLLFGITSAFSAIQAQDVYVISDFKQGGISWGVLQKVQLQKSQVVYQNLLSNKSFPGADKVANSDAATTTATLPMHNGVAATAFDPLHNRIYFSTMFGGEMHTLDLGSNHLQGLGNVYTAKGKADNQPILNSSNQGAVITRMTYGADGYVYGLSNNGDHFFRVATRLGKPAMEQLGALINDPANETMDVKASCTSWGGDMVAGTDGQLYLFSMYQQAFKIDPNTRKATYLGKVSGLPVEFTLNGAAVLEDGRLLLSSAAVFGKYAIIKDIKTLEATIEESEGWFNTSDLASAYLLFSKANNLAGPGDDKIKFMADVFPNPVRSGEMIVHFKSGQTGKYALDLLDIAGSPKLQTQVNLSGEAQRVTLKTASFAKGLYLLRIMQAGQKEVQTIKVLLQ